MKTVETKTSSTANNLIQAKRQPFFNKEGQDSFFSKQNETAQPFFNTSSAIQTKLTIGQANDKYEVEADAMADKVVQRLNQPVTNSIANKPSGLIQRQCSSCEEEEKLQKKEDLLDKETNAVQLKPIFESNSEETNVQAKLINTSIVQTKCATCDQEEYVLRKEEEELPDNDQLLQRKGIDTPSENTSNLESRLNSSKGGGRSLPSDLQTSMGSEFGADFSKVKIHTGSEAVQMSQDIGAQAFTHGSDIYFNEGKYDTNSNSGKHLLAHELTHTVQQGASDVTPSVQKLSWDDVRQAGSSALSSAGRGLTNIGGAISDTVSSGVDTVRNAGASFMRTTLNQYAPGLWDLLTNGVDVELKRRIFQSVMRVVRNLKTQIENSDLVGKIRDFFSNSKVKLKQWKNEVADKCNTLYEKIDALVSFFGDMTDPVIQQIRLGLQTLGGYASAFWDNIGKPAWEAIRQFAGDAWDWLQSTARWIWDRTEGIRQLFVDIWEWIKTQLGLLQDSATSIWDRFKEIAAEVWEEIKSYIEPVLQPLKVLGGLMLAFSPLGPIVAIYQAGPRIWESLKWVVTNWSGWQTLIDLKDQFANEILPAISRGAQQAKLHLQQAVTWVNGIVTSVKQAVKDFLNSIGILQVIDEVRGFMAELRLLFNQIKAEFDSLYTSLKEDFNAVMTLAKDLLQSLWECVRPILDFVLGIVALVINPFMWPVYAVALITRLAWFFLPRDLKIVAIDFVIELLRGAVEYLRPSGVPEQIWNIFRSGAVSFLNRLDGYTPDEKINFVNKVLNLLIDPRTYGAWMRGLIGGFLHQAWTLVSGVISLGIEMPSIIQGIINFFRNLVPDVEMLERMLDRITELSTRLQELLARENLLQYIINTVMNSPQVLVDWINETTGEAANFAENTGREMAEGLFTYVNTMTSSGVGYKIGDIIGRILFEVLLTKGIGFVIGKITQGIAWFRRILGMLRSGARNAARGLLQRAKELFTWVMDKMRTLFQRLGEALGRIFASFKRLIDDIIAWIMRALKGTAQNILAWSAFVAQVMGLTRGINTGYEGKTRREAANLFNAIRLPFNSVAGVPFGAGTRNRRLVQDEENSGYWKLMARKKFGVNPIEGTVGTQVGRILIKRVISGPANGRWNRGKQAVRERIREGFSPSDLNKRTLDNILEPYKENFRYRKLEVEWDERENDWNVIASMSPAKNIGKIKNGNGSIQQKINKPIIQKADTTDKEIAEINQSSTLPDGSARKPIPITWYKNPNNYPTISFSNYNSSRWRGRTPQRPLNTPTVNFGSETWIEIPPTQYNSFPTSGSLSSRYSVITRSNGRRYLRIGIANRFMPSLGFIVRRQRAGGRSRAIQGRFRTLMRNYNNTNLRQMDHVIDIGLGGRYSNADHINNLWPLDTGANQGGNQVYGQEVTFWDSTASTVRTVRLYQLQYTENKFFKIERFA
ncbi:DUF4157 domain-containing protein [uncultured Psychroserpens sp.]|uniref:eCIS core domain-containing protein n=1 Tax=uncultured Psychroserpens sp. TaxID=255436 RepID=UPI002623387A|nr:DUF4157 domain-containing protein [uncultured Psychroserpens sp.]